MAEVCSPALWAKTEAPTKGCWGLGAMLTSSAMWWDTGVRSSRRSGGMVPYPELEGEIGDGGRQVGVARTARRTR